VAESFYLLEGNRFVSTELTRGPWSEHHQHAGPPSALLAFVLERTLPPGMRIARLTVEILKPIPIAVLSVVTRVLRAGRKVQWLSADLYGEDGRMLAQAHAVAIRTASVALPVSGDPVADPIKPAGDSKDLQFKFFSWDVGYHTGTEWRIARGKFGKGPVAAWIRMRYPLLLGETPSPLQRVMIAADSGNGVSQVLDPRKFSFVNPDLTVYLHRVPVGEWICLDARTIAQANGIGLAETRLLDEQGVIGRSMQSLIIEARA